MRRRMSAAIRNRVVCVLLPGKSIEELEKRIEEFKDYDICWAGINQFNIIEDNILNKINKKFDVIQDCSEVAFPAEFEPSVRVPRIGEFLKRGDNNAWLTTEKVFDTVCKYGMNWAKTDETYLNKAVFVEDYVLKVVPNSLTLYLIYLTRFGAKKIILFGCDGYIGEKGKDLHTYYKQDLVAKERQAGFHDITASGLHSDTYTFDQQFTDLYTNYCRIHALKPLSILNCSPNSSFTIFPRINYDQAKESL